MTYAVEEPDGGETLRHRAVANLCGGTAAGRKRSSAPQALAVLHDLAASPATAVDALALLHELQVHQVELDLQRQELRSSLTELESALARQTARIDLAPAGFLTISATTVVSEINAFGVRLLGAESHDLKGLRLTSLLSPAGAAALQTLLAAARDGLPAQTCPLQLLPRDSGVQSVLATACLEPETGGFTLVLMAGPPARPDGID